MTREITNVLSIGIDIYNIVICGFVILSLANKNLKKQTSLWFFLLTVSILIFNIADMANWFSEGTAKPWHSPYLKIMTFIYYAAVPFSVFFFMKYLKHFLHPVEMSEWFFRIIGFVSILYLVGVILSAITGFYYVIDAENYYHRGSYYAVSLVFDAFFYIVTVIPVIVYRKHFNLPTKIALLSYSLFPIIMVLVQMNLYGLSLVNTGMTLSVLMIFVYSHRDLESSFLHYEQQAEKATEKLIRFQEHTINCLSNLVESGDSEGGQHAQRTSLFVQKLAIQTQKDGYYPEILTDNYIRMMTKAAPLHDIGKICTPDAILFKNGPLTEKEREIANQHTINGGRIVRDIVKFSENQEFIDISVGIARNHHEWWDGSGFPDKLAGENIPLCARMMAIANAFDVLVFKHHNNTPVSLEEALKIIQKESGTHFDPILVLEFLKIREELIRILP